MWIKTVKLNILNDVISDTGAISDTLLQAFQDTNDQNEKRNQLLGLLILTRAINQFTAKTPFYLLRPEDWRDYFLLRLDMLFWKKKDTAFRFFYETFGYRFVISLDLDTKAGKVVHIRRVVDKREKPDEALQEYQEKVTKNKATGPLRSNGADK